MEQRVRAVAICVLLLLLFIMSVGYTVSSETDYLEINHPDDIVFRKGEANKSIDWFPESDHPLEWSIFQNGVEISTGEWHFGNVSQSLSHLDVGNYTFYLEIMSDPIWGPPNTTAVYCLLAMDTVYVTVLEPESTLPLISATIMLVFGAVGLVSVFLLIIKKRLG